MYDHLPKAEFGFPGPLRDQLVTAILDGTKTATTGLALEYEMDGDQLPEPGQRSVVIDSSERAVAVIEVMAVRVLPLNEVGLEHAIDEGEGHDSLAAWRTAHEAFWCSDEMRRALGADFAVDDRTEVVLERFRVVERL